MLKALKEVQGVNLYAHNTAQHVSCSDMSYMIKNNNKRCVEKVGYHNRAKQGWRCTSGSPELKSEDVGGWVGPL